MSQSWKSFLFFSKTERRGIILLTVIIVIILWLPLIINTLLPDDEASLDAFAARTQSFLEEKSALKEDINHKNGSTGYNSESIQTHTDDIQINPFDPNQISLQQWLSMGFPGWLAERILKFREKGGKFKKADDLEKIYGMPPALFEKVKPFIVLPGNKAGQVVPEARPNRIVELNAADSVSLTTIPGMSPYIASRILKYRNKLGGFFGKEQLQEIYGINPENLGRFVNSLTIDTNLVKKININTCDFKDLMKHPYGGYATAKAICRFREKYGKIKVINEVRQSQVLPDSVFRKLAPYLKGGDR